MESETDKKGDDLVGRVLMVHNYYQRRSPSGENVSFESEVALLRRFGVEVDLFTRDNEDIASFSRGQKLMLPARTVWSREARVALRRQLVASRPDIVHFQNTFPLVSPSVYSACRELSVPVVQTLRNYRLLCPGAIFYRNERPCEDCMGKTPPWPGVLHACYRNSRFATATVAAMLTVHRLLRTWLNMVDIYITPTGFTRQKFIASGFPADRIIVKPNFVDPDPGVGSGQGDYALFVGRLSGDKGIATLLSAWERLDCKLPLKIVGDGPEAHRVAAAAEKSSSIEWLGRKPLDDVYALMGNALLLVFPSEWYETFGRVAVEAFAKGTPVIASNIGAIAELVDDGRTGLLFTPGDPDDLAAKVEWALAHPQRLAQMRREARAEFEAKYTAERNYAMLMEIYAQAIEERRRQGAHR